MINNQTFSECIVLYLDNIQQHYQHNNSDPKKRLALLTTKQCNKQAQT